MRDESEIELNEFENQLRAIPLPGSKLDSAATMYQAGWAAAMASISEAGNRNKEVETTNVDSNRSGSAWNWKLTSAALSGLSCCLALLLLQANLSTPNSLSPSNSPSPQGPSVSADASETGSAHLLAGNQTRDVTRDTLDEVSPRQANNASSSNQLNFIQSIIGPLAATQVNISQKRIDQALTSFDSPPDISIRTIRAEMNSPARTFVPTSADQLLQELFSSQK